MTRITHLLLIAGWAMTVQVHAAPTNKTCKSVPSSDTWPSPDIWSAFNQSIDGRLIRPTPPGAVCHPEQTTFSTTQCPATQAAWYTEAFHSDDPVSAYWNNWSQDTCLPDPKLPCSAAGYPVYVVNATTAGHVKAGIDFAKKHKIRLIVKNSGHDFIGRSSAPNSLSIWVHHMKGIVERPDGYKPAGCNFTIAGHAITAAAGTQMLEAYRTTAKMNRTVVGGNGRTVALGGFMTGGGHSILAPHYGMAADQVLEMEVVTAGGEILTLNECQNQDLFWAMRGGGGSTFGVLTSVTLQTVPTPAVATLTFQFATSASNPAAFDAVAYFVSQFPTLGDAGVSGYPIIFNRVANSSDGTGRSLVSGIIGKIIMVNQTASTLLSKIEPLFEHINQTWTGFEFYTTTTHHDSFGAWYEENYDPSPVGYNSVMSSRLLDAPALTSNLTATKLALQSFSAGGQATVYIVSGKGVFNARPRGGATAVNPAWRKTYVHATTSMSFAPLDASARQFAIAQTNLSAAALREITPGMGAYVNEASKYEPNWQQTFWGSNYDRLVQIKRTVDPDDVFWCTPCVGNERWQEVDNLLCRV